MLEIRNQDDVRKNSINNKIIDQKNHFDWFKKILKVKTEYLYIILIKGVISGLLRISKKNNIVEWSFYLKKDSQKIYGSFVEYLAIKKMFNLKKITSIQCFVFDYNLKVISLHKKFGFTPFKEKKEKEGTLFYFELDKKKWATQKILIKKKLRI